MSKNQQKIEEDRANFAQIGLVCEQVNFIA